MVVIIWQMMKMNPTKSDRFSRIGIIRPQDLDELKEWCKEQQGLVRSDSTYVVGNRWEKWFGKGWKLTKDPEIFEAEHNERIHRLGERLLPGNHSCLFLYYAPGGFIRPHRDHKISENWVVQVNVGTEVYYDLEGDKHLIKDGEIFGFDSKLLHSTTLCPQERWAVSWRYIKSEYLTEQLSLI